MNVQVIFNGQPGCVVKLVPNNDDERRLLSAASDSDSVVSVHRQVDPNAGYATPRELRLTSLTFTIEPAPLEQPVQEITR